MAPPGNAPAAPPSTARPNPPPGNPTPTRCILPPEPNRNGRDAPMTAPLLIPLPEIDPEALTRDRIALDPDAQLELRTSIVKSGLRMPIEVYAFPEPRGACRYGLVSGFRRLAVFRDLHDAWGLAKYATIPAFLRAPADRAEALAAMVEENAIRADVSPWERARVAVEATTQGVYGTVEEAVDHLYPAANPMKRSRIRSVARVVEVFDHILTDPERLSLRQLLRLANAIRNGFAEPLETAVRQTRLRDPASQWAAMLPYLVEVRALHRHRRPRARHPHPRHPRPPPPHPQAPPPSRHPPRGRPRRLPAALHRQGGDVEPARRGAGRHRALVLAELKVRVPLAGPRDVRLRVSLSAPISRNKKTALHQGLSGVI